MQSVFLTPENKMDFSQWFSLAQLAIPLSLTDFEDMTLSQNKSSGKTQLTCHLNRKDLLPIQKLKSLTEN